MDASSSERDPKYLVHFSVAIELVGGLLVAAYFVLASVGVQARFGGGGLVGPDDLARGHALVGAAGACVVLTVVAAGLVGLLAMYIGDRRRAAGTSTYPYPALLFCSWTFGFVVALFGTSQFVANNSKPMSFGWIWFVVGGVIGPALLAIPGLRRTPVDA